MGTGIQPYQNDDSHFIDGKKKFHRAGLGDFINKVMK
jgi:hypothetical protein